MTNHLILLSLKLGEWYKGNLLQLVGPPEAHAMPIGQGAPAVCRRWLRAKALSQTIEWANKLVAIEERNEVAGSGRELHVGENSSSSRRNALVHIDTMTSQPVVVRFGH